MTRIATTLPARDSYFFHKWASAKVVETIAAFSFWTHFDAIKRGVVDLRDVVYFVSVIVLMIFTTPVVLEGRKSG